MSSHADARTLLAWSETISLANAIQGVTSEERREGRYKRRKAKREAAKVRRNEVHTFESAIDFNHLRKSFYRARRGSNWKASVQSYGRKVLSNSIALHNDLLKDKDISKGFYEFDIRERGKVRHIMSVHISERVVQKSVCDYGIVPVIERSLIYDNGASQKGKGTEFVARRLKNHLRRWHRLNGHDGYVVLWDGHDFFGSMRHEVVRENMERWITDGRLIDLTMKFIDACPRGLSLGSQVNQINAVAYPDRIDHYIKDRCGEKFYGRYMDDWYLIVKEKDVAQRYLDDITERYRTIGIEPNKKKCQVIKLSRGFRFLQDRFFLTGNGKVIRKPPRENTTRNRRKLKKLAQKLEDHEISYEEVRAYYGSRNGYYKHKNARMTKRRMDMLFNELIIKPFKEGRI